MKIDLTGKVALVTGSSDGIGLAIARGLANAGTSVVVTARLQSRADARGVGADVTTSEGCERLVNAVPAVDILILIHNAGTFETKNFFEISEEHLSG